MKREPITDIRGMAKHKAGVPHFGWTLLADAIAKLSEASGITKQEAAQHIVTAARDGALYTRGRLHHARGHSIPISPAAWEGMDPDPVMSRLCPPNPGLEVQEPFLGAPVVCEVEIYIASLEAWKAGETRPPVPVMQPPHARYQEWPLVWHVANAAPAVTSEAQKVESKLAPNNKIDDVKTALLKLYPNGIPPKLTANQKDRAGIVEELRPSRGEDFDVSPDVHARAIKEIREEAARSPSRKVSRKGRAG